MSAGQFELRMVDEENAGKGKNRGLDLMVYLMLPAKSVKSVPFPEENPLWQPWHMALGMADQIQESSAAIHLDVML